MCRGASTIQSERSPSQQSRNDAGDDRNGSKTQSDSPWLARSLSVHPAGFGWWVFLKRRGQRAFVVGPLLPSPIIQAVVIQQCCLSLAPVRGAIEGGFTGQGVWRACAFCWRKSSHADDEAWGFGAQAQATWWSSVTSSPQDDSAVLSASHPE